MANAETLKATIAELTRPGKGILAADESQPTITKRFTTVGIESTEETRRAYRTMLFTTPGAEQYLAGVILFGLSLPWVIVGLTTLMQRSTPPELQGRVYAAADAMITRRRRSRSRWARP